MIPSLIVIYVESHAIFFSRAKLSFGPLGSASLSSNTQTKDDGDIAHKMPLP